MTKKAKVAPKKHAAEPEKPAEVKVQAAPVVIHPPATLPPEQQIEINKKNYEKELPGRIQPARIDRGNGDICVRQRRDLRAACAWPDGPKSCESPVGCA